MMAVIPYGDLLNIERLPIDAQDVITRVKLVIAGNRAGAELGRLTVYPTDDPLTTETVSYFPWPVTFEYEAPEHATYGCERAFSLPEGVDPFLPPTDEGVPEPDTVVNFANAGSPSAVRDGDPVTYAEKTGTDAGYVQYNNVLGAVGFRARYTLSSGSTSYNNLFKTYASIALSPRSSGVRFYGMTTASTQNLPDTAEPAELYLIVPPDARNATENGPAEGFTAMYGSVTFNAFENTSVNLHAFYPLIPNLALLEDMARRQIRLPGSAPVRVTVAGVVPPDAEHTITGWPGGDLVATVAQHQYELGRTVIDLEQAGAPIGLPAEAIEGARERRVAIDRAVSSAGYSVRMGERQ